MCAECCKNGSVRRVYVQLRGCAGSSMCLECANCDAAAALNAVVQGGDEEEEEDFNLDKAR